MALVKPYNHYSSNAGRGIYSSGAPIYHDPPNYTVHVADPAHGQDANDPNPVWHSPALPAVAQVGEYPGSQWIMTGGVVEMDMTPTNHEGGDTPPMARNERAMAIVSGMVHGNDYGAADKGNWAPPPITFRSERQDYVRIAGNGPGDDLAVSATAVRRGLNSLQENNPEGYRAGEVQWERPDRKFPIGERHHDNRPLILNIAEGGGADIPSQGGAYPLTFDSLARAITNVAARPQARREPIGIGESELSDGALDSYNLAPSATVGQWVVG